MSAFLSDLDFRDLHHESKGGEIRLMLLAPLVYESDLLGRRIIVPARFVTDLGSVPQVLWSVVPPIGKADCAFVMHDWCYQTGMVTRDQADGAMREAMRVCNVRKALSTAIYVGVRVGGWVSWNRYRKAAVVEVAAKVANARPIL